MENKNEKQTKTLKDPTGHLRFQAGFGPTTKPNQTKSALERGGHENTRAPARQGRKESEVGGTVKSRRIPVRLGRDTVENRRLAEERTTIDDVRPDPTGKQKQKKTKLEAW
jgi:hypothetical protein